MKRTHQQVAVFRVLSGKSRSQRFVVAHQERLQPLGRKRARQMRCQHRLASTSASLNADPIDRVDKRQQVILLLGQELQLPVLRTDNLGQRCPEGEWAREQRLQRFHSIQAQGVLTV